MLVGCGFRDPKAGRSATLPASDANSPPFSFPARPCGLPSFNFNKHDYTNSSTVHSSTPVPVAISDVQWQLRPGALLNFACLSSGAAQDARCTTTSRARFVSSRTKTMAAACKCERTAEVTKRGASAAVPDRIGRSCRRRTTKDVVRACVAWQFNLTGL